jgi:dTDP-4-amino-4,6-dideoxygalactose transaminase
VTSNYSYFPILVGPDYPLSRDGLYDKLKQNGIHTRRYFFPLISNMSMYRHLPSASPDNLPVAGRIADQVLCLPIYPGLAKADIARIVSIIRHP